MTAPISDILESADKGERVADIAAREGVTPGAIWKTLRQHRPNRKRAKRGRTSKLREQILALSKVPTEPGRIVELLKVSRQYVYRVLSESR